MSKNLFNRRDMLKVSGGTLLTGISISQTAQANATAISPGEEITGTIESADDRDEFELLVDQGDVIEVEFEKGTRNRTGLDVNVPSRQINAIELGGEESVGEETYRSRYTIIQTGTLNINVGTRDSTVDEPQGYNFTVTRYDGLDEFPATERAEISAGNEISGTIHSENDVDRFELPVSQGDVIEVEFEKGARNQTGLDVNVPSRQIDAIELGGSGSEGQEQFEGTVTIEQTGTIEIGVGTSDTGSPVDNDVVEGQDWRFIINGTLSVDTGEVTGTVTTDNGDSLSGVTLEFVNPNTENVGATTVTSENGTYSVELAADQTYEVVIEED